MSGRLYGCLLWNQLSRNHHRDWLKQEFDVLFFYWLIRYQWMCFKSLVSIAAQHIECDADLFLADASANGATCYDLVNAYVCFCPDRVFRPQCNTTGPISSGVHNHTSVLIASSPCKCHLHRWCHPLTNGSSASQSSSSDRRKTILSLSQWWSLFNEQSKPKLMPMFEWIHRCLLWNSDRNAFEHGSNDVQSIAMSEWRYLSRTRSQCHLQL